jgi:post-segregation antitoxin (ccd killing protein)
MIILRGLTSQNCSENQNHSSKSIQTTRVEVFAKKKTVGVTLPQNLVEKARKRNPNISRITEQALLGILDHIQTQNSEPSSVFLGEASFLKEGSVVPRAGFEPATTRSSAGCSPRLSYLGAQHHDVQVYF